MAGNATWRPRDTHGRLTEAKLRMLPDSAFAFPKQRLGALTGAGQVKETIAAFSEFDGVSDQDRDLAFLNIRKAAQHYRVQLEATDWRQLGTRAPKRNYPRI